MKTTGRSRRGRSHLSALESGQLALEPVSFPLRETVQSAVDHLQPDAAAKGLELRLELDRGLPAWLRGDPARLRQVLLHLIDNAIKLTDEGRVGIRVRRQSREPEKVRVRFAVHDTAPASRRRSCRGCSPLSPRPTNR